LPRPQEYLRPEVVQQVQRLDLKARFIVEGFLAGLHQSPFHGFSVEFAEHRKYVPGDDPRAIDWLVFAKTDRFYVRRYQAETNLDCYLLMDLSASMAYPPPQQTDFAAGVMSKLDYAICIAASIGYLMIHQQDAVGLVTFDTAIRQFLPARSKRHHLTNILATLANARATGPTRLAEVLHEVADRVRKRSLMVLCSDLLTDPAPVIDALHHLRFRGHDVILIQILDISETTFPFAGRIRFEDLESDRTIPTDALAIRQRYLQALADFIETYREAAGKTQADFVQVNTAMTFDKALVEFLVSRKQRF
jgi:uncharacterized protein (DUF58 family)